MRFRLGQCLSGRCVWWTLGSSRISHRDFWAHAPVGLLFLLLASTGCTTDVGARVEPASGPAQGAPKAEDLLVVDCLLPGQIRQLGNKVTYLTPRRPVKVSARDCAIRGGEYVAFD